MLIFEASCLVARRLKACIGIKAEEYGLEYLPNPGNRISCQGGNPVGSWEKLGRTVGLLVLVATLTAASTGNGPVGPLSGGTSGQSAGPPGTAVAETSLPGPADSGSSQVSPDSLDPGQAVFGGRPAGPAGKPEEAVAPSLATPSQAAPSQAAQSQTPTPGLPLLIHHVVIRGETVTGIAARYGVAAETVAASAGSNPNRIYPGQTLTFPSVDGLVHVTRPGDTLTDIARLYQASAKDISWANAIADPANLQVGQALIVPGGKQPRRASPSVSTASSGAPAAAGGSLAWPVRGPISSRFGLRWGRLHSGVDIAASYGTTIRAAAAGRVTFVGWYGRYGRCVIIDHGGGLTTLYGHASTILVSTGNLVDRGVAIAEVGSSGNSTGPHVHFEVRVNGQCVNPLSYLGD